MSNINHRTMQNARTHVAEQLTNARLAAIVERLPRLTDGQAKTLAAHPEVKDKLMQIFGEDLFLAYLKACDAENQQERNQNASKRTA